jgi:hydrogenase nickel incorporation protein HypA/HybF
MHELSIATSIIEMVEEELERRGGARLHAVHLKLGALSGVVQEALLFSYEVAAEGTQLKGSQLLIEPVPVTIYCPNCDAQRQLKSIQNFICPECGTPTPDIVHGKELEIISLEISQ